MMQPKGDEMKRLPLTDCEAMLVRMTPDLGWDDQTRQEAIDRVHPGVNPMAPLFLRDREPTPIQTLSARDFVMAGIGALVTLFILWVAL